MATVKHISSKNADYTVVVKYLTFQHDELSGKPLCDDAGNNLLRDEYLIDGIECTPETFAAECIRLNRQYGKNLSPSDVKTHHYIISFDPADAASSQLVMEKAHAIGMEIAGKFFPGHQAVVCTHPDGHNHSGNMHCHIVINSLRKNDVQWQDYMQRPYDNKAGYKHVQTGRFLRTLKAAVMEICRREGLSQVDLLTPAKEKVTDKEYRKAQRSKSPDNLLLKKLRSSVYASCMLAHSEDEFREILRARYSIDVTESRGKWGYHLQGSASPVRARRLGSAFEKEAVLAVVYSIKEITNNTDGRHVSKSQAVENIRRRAMTVRYLQEHGFGSRDELNEQLEKASGTVTELRAKYQQARGDLKQVNEMIHYQGVMLSKRKIYQAYRQSSDPSSFLQSNYSDIALFESASKALKEIELKIHTKIPTLTELKKSKESLESRRKVLYSSLKKEQTSYKELLTVSSNLEKMLRIKESVIEKMQEASR